MLDVFVEPPQRAGESILGGSFVVAAAIVTIEAVSGVRVALEVVGYSGIFELGFDRGHIFR